MKIVRRCVGLLLSLLLVGVSSGLGVAQTKRVDYEAAIKRGNEKYAKADYKQAIEEYSRVTESDTELYAQALYNIGVCYYELWRTSDAVLMYRKAIKARGNSYPKAAYALGVALEDLGRTKEAREAYEQTISAANGEYAAAHYRLGLIAARDGDYKRAATLFREAIALSGDKLPASHNNLGVMLALMNQLADAEREFKIALKQTEGEFDDATYNLKLCRSLRDVAHTSTQAATLKINDER